MILTIGSLAVGAGAGRVYELTRDSFPTPPVWTSLEVSVRGVRLGARRDQVRRKLGRPTREDTHTRTLEYPGLVIRFGKDRRVEAIGLKKEFAREIRGEAKALLTDAMVTDEAVRQHRLGVESERDTDDVSMSRVHLERVRFSYPERGIELQGTRTAQGTTFSLLTLLPPKDHPPAP